MTDFQQLFDAEMAKQGRSTEKFPSGAYKDYASAVMWSWALWGAKKAKEEACQ